jgi:predicted esterase
MEQHLLKTTRTARYFTLGNTAGVNDILIILHGYGQLASTFIAEFTELQLPGRLIIAPEGLNRFYAKGLGGKPVATWMTSEERENEIADYIEYLERLYSAMVPKLFKGRIRVLGFSQGVATASRWIHHSAFQFTDFVMCSGDIAFELRNPLSEKISNLHCSYITGNNDPLLTIENKVAVNELMQKLNAQFYTFEGGHQLHIPTLKDLFINL